MLKDKLMKHLAKKGAKDLDPMEKDAKMGVIGELGRQASSMLGDKIHPLKKVTVASDSKEGLKAGLDKAAGLVNHGLDHEHDPEKMVESAEEELHADLDHDNEEGESAAHKQAVLGHHSEMDAEGSPAEEAAESPHQESEEDVAAEHADHSPEELDAKIAHLHALRAKKLSGRA